MDADAPKVNSLDAPKVNSLYAPNQKPIIEVHFIKDVTDEIKMVNLQASANTWKARALTYKYENQKLKEALKEMEAELIKAYQTPREPHPPLPVPIMRRNENGELSLDPSLISDLSAKLANAMLKAQKERYYSEDEQDSD